MAVTDLHTLDISTPLDRLFTNGGKRGGAVLSLVSDRPTINVGKNVPLVMGGRAKGALVHEGGKKPDNGRQVTPKPFVTAKIVYSQRVSDEFMTWAEEKQADFVSRLVADWLEVSLPHDLDLIVIHGYDPHTNSQDGSLSDYITKSGSSLAVAKEEGDTPADLDKSFGKAVEAVKEQNITGIAISTDAAAALASITLGNQQKYPGLGVFGLTGSTIAGMPAASSPEVGAVNSTKMIIGDWTQLLLGFAGDAEWKTIEYGNPDGGTADLQQLNQVCIRLEVRFGFRVLDPKALAVVAAAPVI